MITPKQLEANRLNAQKSTGPRSAAGKAVSSQNALKTGLRANSLIIRGESREDLDALIDAFYRQYQPRTPQYRILVDDLIRNSWYLERYDRIEGEFWNGAFVPAENAASMYETMSENGPFYMCLRRCVTTAERNVRVLIDQLQKSALNQPLELAVPDVVEVPKLVTCSPEPPPAPGQPHPDRLSWRKRPQRPARRRPLPRPPARRPSRIPAPAEAPAQPAENNDTTRKNGFVWKNGIDAFVQEAYEHLLFNQRPLREEDLDKIPADRLPAGLEEAC